MPNERCSTTAAHGERASLAVLEALVIGFLVVGSILYVVSLGSPSTSAPGVRASLSDNAEDAVAVLSGIPADEDAYGKSFLSKAIVEALYGQDANLTYKLDSFFPPGTRYNVWLDNGFGSRLVAGADESPHERVSAAVPWQPGWSVAFVATDLRLYDAATPMNVTALPVARGLPVTYGPEYAYPHVEFPNGVKLTLMNATSVPALNGSYAKGGAAGFPTSGSLLVEADDAFKHRSSVMRGKATYAIATDAYLAATGSASRLALNASKLDVTVWSEAAQAMQASRTAELGRNFTVTWDLTPYVVAHAGKFAAASVNTTSVRILAPLPMLNTTMGLYFAEFTASSPGFAGSATFAVPQSAFLGPHLVVVELNSTLRGASGDLAQSARLFDRVDVAFPGGLVPVDPVLRVVLEAWLPDWE